MKISPPQLLKDVASVISCTTIGNENHIITGINEIHRVEHGDLVFVDYPKYYEKALNSAATTILINQQVECPPGKALIFSDDPCRDFNVLLKHYCEPKPWPSNNQKFNNSIIHPSVIIGNDVEIGNGSIIHPGVILYDRVKIGNHCIVHANTVIGSDAFYYKSRGTHREKMYTAGGVCIGNHVEIGASCTIDSGLTADTIIGDHCKLDNHVHVGHDTVIGRNCLFAAQVGIAGCVVIEEDVILWGQVGVPSDIHIGRGAVVLGQSGITKDLEGGKTYFGSPAEEARHKYRELALIRKLPEMNALLERAQSSE